MSPLEQLRRERRLSQAALARLAGVSKNTIYRLEKRLGPAQGTTLRKLADALGVAPKELVSNGGPPVGITQPASVIPPVDS